MSYHFAVTGIGLCVGSIADHEDLIEAITTGKKPPKPKAAPTARHAIRAALKYQDEKPVILIANTQISQTILTEFRICQQRRIEHFARMIQEALRLFEENACENVLLLGQGGEGYAAVLLSRQPERCFAQVRVEPAVSAAEEALMDAMMQFITAVVEIRFAFKLDGSVNNGTCVWHWAEKRTLTRTIGTITVSMEQAPLVNKAVFQSKRYLLPVAFDTIEEARQNLRRLLTDATQQGLYHAMRSRIADGKMVKPGVNLIVLLAEDCDSLGSQIHELLEKSDRLLNEGFRWHSDTGSLYIRKTTQTPKVVFMNPPGGMFHSKPFHRFVSKLYDFVQEPFRPGKTIFYNASQNELLRRYLDEINTTYAVMYLLETIGVTPDYLSGASMGEIVFNLSNCAVPNGDEAVWNRGKHALEAAMRKVLEGRKAQEDAYFGHPVELAKYYLKCDAEKAKQAIANYHDVFVIIEGSPRDLLICGEKTSCRKLVQELGCIPIEMDDPTYVHTPVVEREFEMIRSEILNSGLHLDVDAMPYQLFSTYLKKTMDSSSEMFAENFASIITRTVNYTEAVKTLYHRDARVFIDLSTTQLCGNWAKTTLSQYTDAEVVSIYEDKATADYLIELCAVLLAWNIHFDFDKLYSRLTFVSDARAQEAPAAPKTILRQYIANQMALNERAYNLYLDAQEKLFAKVLQAHAGQKTAAAAKTYLWDREQAIEMTDRSMAAVLGEQYREVDQYPIRARMPLPPFLFVSRIISIDAEFGKLRPSSIVAEYDLDEDCVFRMGDSQISPLVGAEASHIGIFLLAYMGIDAMFHGNLTYRAIGSSQVSYSERPFRVGDTLRTVLKINRFVQNGSTLLVFFTFETYNGGELIAITETTGGFFTKEQLASNKGIIEPKMAPKALEPREFPHFTNLAGTSYDEAQVGAFYSGNYEACFGKIKKPLLRETYYLPHDLKMIDRITKIDYNGGMYGRGIICGEKQITPDMWPFKAHFKNDPVFPAIIMTDGITQLGVFLFLHAGLLTEYEHAAFTAVNGNTVISKFRGQARQGYSTLRYELHVKEVVQTDHSISVFFDAKIFYDDLQIIQVESYALKILSDPN